MTAVIPKRVLERITVNPSTCVNPDHLEPVTQQENIRRGLTGKINHRNSSKTHCKNGHEFSELNTYIRPNGNRKCKTCANNSEKARYHGKS